LFGALAGVIGTLLSVLIRLELSAPANGFLFQNFQTTPTTRLSLLASAIVAALAVTTELPLQETSQFAAASCALVGFFVPTRPSVSVPSRPKRAVTIPSKLPAEDASRVTIVPTRPSVSVPPRPKRAVTVSNRPPVERAPQVIITPAHDDPAHDFFNRARLRRRKLIKLGVVCAAIAGLALFCPEEICADMHLRLID
jgi:hypothetical protein